MGENMTTAKQELMVLNIVAIAQHIITETNGGGYSMPEELYDDSYALATEISQVVKKQLVERILKQA